MVRRRWGGGGMVYAYGGGWDEGMGMVAEWAGESSRCEMDCAPTVGIGGDTVARYAVPMRVGGNSWAAFTPFLLLPAVG